jgi:DNA polymerase-3 subunit delta'
LTPFRSVCNQDIAKRIVLNAYNRSRLATTYLFYGDEGTGKWCMAIALAALINCERPVQEQAGGVIDACGECRNCRQVANLIFPELHLVFPLPPHRSESEAIDLGLEFIENKRQEPYKMVTSSRQATIPINMVRQIRKKTSIKPSENAKRVVLFYQMERMLPASADSLLKLIEEPPPETIIILTANDPDNLPATVVSRSQKVQFRSIHSDEIISFLKRKYDLAHDRAETAARLSGGSIGRAIYSIENDHEQSLRQVAFLMFRGLFVKDNPSAVATVNEFLDPNDRGEVERILYLWQSFLSDIIHIKYGRELSELANADLAPEMERIAIRIIGDRGFSSILDELGRLLISLRRNIHIRPAMTALALSIRKHVAQSA